MAGLGTPTASSSALSYADEKVGGVGDRSEPPPVYRAVEALPPPVRGPFSAGTAHAAH